MEQSYYSNQSGKALLESGSSAYVFLKDFREYEEGDLFVGTTSDFDIIQEPEDGVLLVKYKEVQ